jgi:GTP pyrophosphokinase
MNQLQNELLATGVNADISGRAKHIYSIWRKMQRKGLEFSQIYDVRAVRVLVPEMRDCYTALGIVHTLWRHIPRSSTTTSPTPRRTATARCTRR